MRHAPIPQIEATGTGDADLVARALARDEAAIRGIMQANNRRLYRLARGILRNDAEAEDVVQETYVRASPISTVFAAIPVWRPGWRASR
jgi:RNA polymerase sigma-70 factor (ECF subfamily)